jgi:hypothetical protein
MPRAVAFVGGLIMIVLGAVLTTFGAWLFTEVIRPKPIYVNVQVFDDGLTKSPLKDVAVTLGLNDVEPKRTGDFGTVRFELARKHRNEIVTPQLRRDGYNPLLDGNKAPFVKLAGSEQSVIMTMKKEVAPPALAPTPVFERKTYSSGSLPSGRGADWSPLYTLCSDPEPPGWSIVESSFVLTGDRQCNGWARCQQVSANPEKVCWTFQMQGHNEQTGGLFDHGNTGVQFSAGNLSVQWKH